MADQSDYMDTYSPGFEGTWRYYQFMYRDGEAVVVQEPNGEQHAFYIHSGPQFRPAPHNIVVREVGPAESSGYFKIEINGRTHIHMRTAKDGISRGAREHYQGTWTSLSKTALQMAAQGVNVPLSPRPWRDIAPQQPVPVAMPWGSANDPLGVQGHPSGLHENDLEPCKACDSNQGACYECNNTGLVPKQQRSIKMDSAELIAVIQIQAGAKIVACQYVNNGPNPNAGGQVYHFKNVAALPLAKDDLVVVQTGNGFSLAKVVDADVRVNTVQIPLGQLKHIVSKVDLSSLQVVLEGENNAMHALALSEVTERMNKYKEQLGDGTFNSMAALLAPPAKTE